MTELDSIANYNNLNREQFYNLLNKLDDYYYNEQPLVTDEVYDFLLEEYQRKFEPYNKIGTAPRNQAVPMPYPLPSLDKIKEPEKIEKFQNKYPGSYLIEDKIDGVSMLYISGPVAKLYTRGGGTEGEDKSYLIPYLNLPKPNQVVAVRGELVIPRKVFQDSGSQYARALNMTTGLVNSKEDSVDFELIKQLKFYAYRLFNPPPNSKPSDERAYLSYLGFNLPKFTVLMQLNSDNLNTIYKERQQQSEYDMDGLVVYSNLPLEASITNPKTAFAFKPLTETKIVKVTHVEWSNGSRQGKLKPVIVYETVFLTGGNLSRATAHNARFVVNNSIGPGAVIRIVRSGTTIPSVIEVIEKSPTGPQLPTIACHWDENEVDLLSDEITKSMIVDSIVHFLTTLGVKSFGEGRVAKLVEAGVHSLDQFLSLNAQQVSSLEGFKNLPEVFFNELWEALSNVKLSTIAVASGFFPGIATKRWADISETFPNILQWNPYDQETIIERIKQVRGIDTLAEVVAENLAPFYEWLSRWPRIKIVVENNKKTGQLSGRVFVFTGCRDGEMSEKLLNMGAEIRENVSKTTTDLIYAKEGTNSYNKALQYGMTLHDYKVLKRQLSM